MRNRRRKSTNRSSFTIAIIVVIAIVWCIYAIAKTDIFTAGTKAENTISAASSGHYDNLEHTLLPPGTPSQEAEYTGFVLSFNADNHTPNYVAWELLGSETDGQYSRTNKFWTDENIKGCADTKDYTRSGFDRGHLCPAADNKWSAQAMQDCFTMANMCPQTHSLNAGAWKTLEEKERIWAQRDSALIIVAGPIYQKDDKLTIGNNRVRVPSAFFKVIIAPYLSEPRGIGFVYPNDHAPGNMQNYVKSIDYIENLTGMDFFHNLPDDIENEIESQSSFKAWNQY